MTYLATMDRLDCGTIVDGKFEYIRSAPAGDPSLN